MQSGTHSPFIALCRIVVLRGKMADNKRWFKVWTTVLNDPHLFTMSLEDVARWFLLGALTAEQGNSGNLKISKKQLCNLFRNDNENDNKNSLNNMPNLEYTNDNDTITVTFLKWSKYQVDSTVYERVKKHRKKANDNDVRREEKRREKEEKKKEYKEKDFITSLKANPAYKEIDIERELSKMDAWLSTPKGKGRKKTTQFILNWLNKIDVSMPSKGVTLADQYKPL